MSSAAPSLYEPINRYKPVGPDNGGVDGPVEYLTVGGIRLPTQALGKHQTVTISRSVFTVLNREIHSDVQRFSRLFNRNVLYASGRRGRLPSEKKVTVLPRRE